MSVATAAVPRKVGLAYGRGRIEVALRGPSPAVVAPRATPAHPSPRDAVRRALVDPVAGPAFRDVVTGDDVVISVCDVTRAQPRHVMLPVILDEIAAVRPTARVTVLVATGTHRASTPEEKLDMFGPAVLSRVEVVDHDARDASTLVALGTFGNGVPLELNRAWVDADVRITTGFVEPHFFAGFSGGPKMVAPGLAGLATTMVLHDARRIGHPLATWGETARNPVHVDIRACAAACPPHFSVDVLLNPDQEITHAYGGELFAMHEAARATAREQAMRRVAEPFDVVVTTGSGYPLDQSLYQAVKGIAAAERIVRPGGTIVLAAECADGLPDHGSFAEVLQAAPTARALLDLIASPGFSVPDQWQVQILARVLDKAQVQIRCDGLGAEQVRAAHLEPIDDVEAAVEAALRTRGAEARVCYLPEGPQTIPYVERAP